TPDMKRRPTKTSYRDSRRTRSWSGGPEAAAVASGASSRPSQLPRPCTSGPAPTLRLPRPAAASLLSGDVNAGCRDEAVMLPVVVVAIQGADVTESEHARGSRRWSPWMVLVAALVVGGCTN